MEELEPSELGTLKYWDERYREEIKNFLTHGDPGEIWFGEDIVDRVVKWINKNLPNKKAEIADIGCGNGMLLVELSNERFNNLYGFDYSEKAIELAKAIATKQKLPIFYNACNVLEGINGVFDVIHDKGTYDAISLSENASVNRTQYIQNIYTSLKDDGVFVITSCNWTQNELDSQFEGRFRCHEIIPTPQFRFAGKVGNVVTCSVYKKCIIKD